MTLRHFEALCTAGLSGRASEETARVRLIDACKMYRGRFLSDASGELWATGPDIRMHTYYLRAGAPPHRDPAQPRPVRPDRQPVPERPGDRQNGRIDQPRADPLPWPRAAATRRAIQHYNQITELYYSQLGVQPSEELRGLYHRIAAVERKVGADIDSICADLRESDTQPGAFVCPVRDF